MNLNENISQNGFNNTIQEDEDSMGLMSEGFDGSGNEGYRENEIKNYRKEKYEGNKNANTHESLLKNNKDNIDTKLGFDIRNVLRHAYLPVCIEKMKEGEYVYKWNNNNIFQKKTLKFVYLDTNNYCIRWNSKKKKLKENKNLSLYICDIIKILDGSESPFFKKKEEEKSLSIEIISIDRSLRITFLDIQRWKMWLFGLMYYHYKLVNKSSRERKKLKPFIYESNKLYDNYIISGLKDINVLTLSQLYIILRSLNIYINMKILYHYFSIYKNKGTINYYGFTKILEHIFSNNHISIHFNMYKNNDTNYIDKNQFINFLVDIQCEGKSEERIFRIHKKDNSTRLIPDQVGQNEVKKKEDNQAQNLNNNEMDTNQHIVKGNQQIKEKNEHNISENISNDNKISENNSMLDEIANGYNLDYCEWQNLMKTLDVSDNQNEHNLQCNANIELNNFMISDHTKQYDKDYTMILNVLKDKYGISSTTSYYDEFNMNSHNKSEKDYKRETYTYEGNDGKEQTNEISKEDKNKDDFYFIQTNIIYKSLNTIKKYNIPFVITNEGNHYLTQIGLVYFLLSKENSIMCPEYAKVYQNMNLPLCNYWINSSHNSYLGRKQIFSESSIEQYIYILIDGCRCVEFDCYYFNKNIVVYHGLYGYKLTSSILFCDTLIACKMFGFSTSPYPIILSLEIHCKNKHKNLIAKILIYILGNQLYIPKTKDEINNITPNNCRNKFLVKYKHFDNNDTSSFYNIFEGLKSVMYDELGYFSDIINEEEPINVDESKEYGMIEKNHEKHNKISIENQNLESENQVNNYIEQNNSNHTNYKNNEAQKKNKNSDENNMWGNEHVAQRDLHEMDSNYSSSSSSKCLYEKDIIHKTQIDENHRKQASFSNNNSGFDNSSTPNNISTSDAITNCSKNVSEGVHMLKEEDKKKQDNEKYKNNVLNKCSCLKGYVFRSLQENRTYNEICSISENKFIKLIKKNEDDVIKYNQKTLMRVYPSGTRLASTNFNPIIFWSAGIQFVALNYQYNGLSMLLNKGRFLENGGKHSGYILKPELLRFNKKHDYDVLSLNIQILSLHQINLLFSIKNKYQEKKLKKELFKMDMIQRIQTHKKISNKRKKFKYLQKLEREKKNTLLSDIQSDDSKKKKKISDETLLKKFKDNDNDVNYIHKKFAHIEKEYEDMLTEYKSFLLCSTLSHSSSFNSCSSVTTTSNNTTDSNKKVSSKSKKKNFYQAFLELKKANNLFFYLYVTISIHGYNEQKCYFKTEIAKVNFYDINYCWPKPSNFQMKIMHPSLALIVFELKSYDTVKSEIIACACFPVKCLREGIRFVPLCDKHLKDIKGSGILVNLKFDKTTENI
ncbi:phosphoinositide-specific phospholipase C, putative [Plasmodium chabaudi adami]|uniref:Phosphoinositide phospholipase C n=1 Tax=Plasmodium chabaudi adami TaxID=5826 RepID=A0A1D3S056_PLACE|nr:phosphoinositide-specific phospholipase C, putative [Plasmodium chabaudi adami]